MNTAADSLPQLLAEYERVRTALIANFNRPTGGRGKQGLRRTDAAIRRGAQYCEQLRSIERQIRALGGTVPGDEPKAAPEPVQKPVPVSPVAALPDPRTMTRETLQAEDAALELARQTEGSRTISPRHRAVKSALGAFAAADIRARAAARRSEAAKRGAVTRAQRKAAGLPPKRLEMFSPPMGGWTDADRVNC